MENLSFKTDRKLISADSAISSVKSGQRVFVRSVASALLLDVLTARANKLSNVKIIRLYTEEKTPYAKTLTLKPTFDEI